MFGITDFIRFKTKDTRKYRVKGADIKIARFAIPQNSFYTLFHFTCSLVSKGECQNIKGIYLVGCHQMRNSCSEDFGFTTTRPRHNHDGTILMQHCFALSFIQTLEIFLHARKLKGKRTERGVVE